MSAAAAAVLFPQDRNLDWLDELERVAAAAESLTPSARHAVLDVVESIAREDGTLPQGAMRLLSVLAEPPAEAEAEDERRRPDVLRALRLRLVATSV